MTASPRFQELVDFARSRTERWFEDQANFTLTQLGIVGAGVMGTAIAAQAAAHGLVSTLFDVDTETVARSKDRVAQLLVEHHGFTLQEASEIAAQRIRTTDQPDPLTECEVVVESTPEIPAVKQAVFQSVEPVLSDGAVLGSNTSTIPIGRLASMLGQPERLVGLHFFHPVGQRPLIEIIRSRQTADRTFAGALAVAKAFDRPVILVGDSPGFVVNRLLMPYLTEAMELLLEGVSIDRVESVARSFGMAKGPLELLDEIGLDTTLHGGRILWETWPERITVSPLLIPMYKKRLHGVKTGGGFFVYDPDGLTPAEVNPAAVELIAYWSRVSPESDSLTDQQIVERLFRPMADEARRLLDEQVVTDSRDIQLAALFGLGFPEQQLDYLDA